MTTVTMMVDGTNMIAQTEGRAHLSTYLRNGLGLTGTKIGCVTSQCGACAVHLDGVPVKSCTGFVQDVAGADTRNITGMPN